MPNSNTSQDAEIIRIGVRQGRISEREASLLLEKVRRRQVDVPPVRKAVEGTIKFVKDTIETAKGDPSDLPELPQDKFIPGTPFAIQDALSLSRGNPLKQAQIADNLGLNVDISESGRPVVEIEGEKFSLNRSGISPQDVNEFISEAVFEVAGGKALGTVGSKFLGKAGQILGTGAGTGAASVAQDKIAQTLGSDLPVDQKKALILGALGSLGEIGGMFVDKFFTKFASNPKLVKDGALTEKGVELLESAGFDSKIATPEFINVFETVTPGAANVSQAARVAEAESLPQPVRLSKGDVNQNITQQAREDDLLKGTHGQDAADIAKSFKDAQAQELRTNVDLIQETVGSGRRVTETGQGAGITVDALRDAKDLAKQEVRNKYDLARQTKATVPLEMVKEFRKSTKDALDGFDIDQMPTVQKRLKELEVFKHIQGHAKIEALENWRKRIVQNKGTTSSEQTALTILKHHYDGFLEKSLDNALIKGDASAISKWQAARKSNAVYKQMFDSDRVIKKLIEVDTSPEQAANYIFGASKLGGKDSAVQVTKKIKKILGVDSIEFKALKEEAFLRFFKNQPTKGFSAQKFVTELDNTLKTQPTLMRELFEPDEINLIRQFRNVAAMTIKQPGSVNHSASALTIIRNFKESFGQTGRIVSAIVNRFTGPIKDEFAKREATELGAKVLTPKQLFRPGTVGSITASLDPTSND